MKFCGLKFLVKVLFLLCLIVTVFQCVSFSALIPEAAGEATISHRSIDLYTQKEPFSGRGPDQPSDAFAPQEEVVLYAYVTYRDDPVPGKIVAFEIRGPVNRFENLSFSMAAVTDSFGLANVSFRVPWPNGHPEEAIFGVWNVIAVVDIAEVAVNDTLSFVAGCIVRVLDVEIVDCDNVSRSTFAKSERMDFRLTVENIAFTEKTATLVVDVYDNLSVSLGQAVLVDRQIPLGVTEVMVGGLLIPQSASLGDGVAYANAYTALPASGGIPWCYAVSTKFSIVKVIVHDVAVIDVRPSVTEAYSCQGIDVWVVVKNEGNLMETFDVSAYYDSDVIGTLTVTNLAPEEMENITFRWCTCCLRPGNYTLSAEASVVPEEVDIDDNTFKDGVVRIMAWEPPTPAECIIPKWLLALLFVLAVLFGANLVVIIGFALYWKQKKSEEKESTNRIAASSAKDKDGQTRTSKTCSVCGNDFPAVYTFCPYCMSFQGNEH